MLYSKKKIGVYSIVLLWVLALGYAYKAASNSSWQQLAPSPTKVPRPPLSRLTPNFVKILTLGHKQVFDDFLLMWMIQLTTIEGVDKVRDKQLGKIFIDLLRYKPHLESFYLLGCYELAMRAKLPKLCFPITETALQEFPESWRIPMMQAYIEGFVNKNKSQAAFFYSLAASRPESPEYVVNVAKKMLADESVTREEIEQTMKMIVDIPGSEKFSDFIDDARSETHEP